MNADYLFDAPNLDSKKFKRYVKASFDDQADYEDNLRAALEAIFNADLSRETKLKRIYREMRPLKVADRKAGGAIMRRFISSEALDKIFFGDLCLAVHENEKRDFRTKISLESALFILVALARGVLDKETVKSIMRKFGKNLFETYGRRKSLKNFIERRKRKGKPIIKLRKKERLLLKKFQREYGREVGLEKYLDRRQKFLPTT